jgi:hypothetical protein
VPAGYTVDDLDSLNAPPKRKWRKRERKWEILRERERERERDSGFCSIFY